MKHKLFLIFVCVIAAFCGLLFGFDTGVISGALVFITEEFNLSGAQQGMIVSSMMFGAVIGACTSGFITNRKGRKLALMLASILFFAGTLGCALSNGVGLMVVGRIMLGLAVGIASFATPIYLSEIAPKHIRGTMISIYQLMITIGILGSYCSNTLFSHLIDVGTISATVGWRWMFGVVAIPTAILFFCFLFLPQSPRWLNMVNRSAEAEETLVKLRGTREEAQAENEEIKNSIQVKTNGWSLLKNNSNFRRTVVLGILLQAIQQLTGINIIMYYAPIIFKSMGFDTEMSMWATVAIGLTNVLSTFIAIALVDRLGRKVILYGGFLVMGLSFGVLSTFIGSLSQATIAATPFLGYLSVAMLLLFIVGFAASAGPLIWVLCSEIQPMQGRDLGVTISTAANWFSNMIIAAVFPMVLAGIGGTWTFLILAILNISFIVFTKLYIPETKGVSLEQIEKNLMAGKKLKDLGWPN